MRNTHRRQYDSLVRISALCLEHRAELEKMPLGKQLVAELEQQKDTAADAFTSQSSGRNDAHIATVQRREGVKTLRKTADRMLTVAAAIERHTGAARQFPKVRRGPDRLLLSDARALYDATEPIAAELKDSGDLREDLGRRVAAVESAMATQASGRETHVGGLAGVAQALKAGLLAMRAIEPLYLKAFGSDPEEVARWKNARRIGPARPTEDAPASQTPDPGKTETKSAVSSQ